VEPKVRRFGERKEERIKRAIELASAYSKSPLIVWRGDELVYAGRAEPRVKLEWSGEELVAVVDGAMS